jgi:hypothetical protein
MLPLWLKQVIMEEYDELDEYIDTLINEELTKLIKGDIGLSTCQFFKEDGKGGVTPFATGVMVEFGPSCYILTASHVIEDWSKASKLFVPLEEAYVSVTGHAYGTEMDKKNRYDIAYIKLKPEMAKLLRYSYRFIPAKKMLHHNKSFFEPNYCIFGYPVINQKKVDGKIKTFGSAYYSLPCQDKVFEYYRLDPLAHYAFEFQGKGVNIQSNKTEKIRTEHYGLSGCGVWYVDIDFKRNKFKSSAQLIGVMTEFRKGKYQCLIGNRLEIIMATIERNEGVKIKRTI